MIDFGFNLKTEICNNRYLVSTVALVRNAKQEASGLHHWLGGAYETMIFPIIDGEVDYGEVHCRRHKTASAARAHHRDVCTHPEKYLILL